MENTSRTTAEDKNEKISIRDLIVKIQEWTFYLLRKWHVIGFACVIGAAVGLAVSLWEKPKYEAELTFILEESKSNPLGSYAGIASQFGIDLGANTGSGIFAGDNIMEFLRSRLMVEKTLLTPVKINGREHTLADFYIDIYNLKEKWAAKVGTANASFPADRKIYTLQQDSLLGILYNNILTKHLQVAKPDRKLSFISVKTITTNQLLSKWFTETLVLNATNFYIQTKTKRSKASVDVLKAKADSLERLLNLKTFQAAASRDLNVNPGRQVAVVEAEVATRDKFILQTVYGEVTKNLELSRLSMAQETPIIQIVDEPILPLFKVKIGKLKALVGGIAIAFGLIVFILLVRKLYKDIMSA